MLSKKEIINRHADEGQETLETDTRYAVRLLTTYDGIILDLGSAGFRRKKEIMKGGGICYSVDINPRSADIVANLNSDFPFDSSSVNLIIASEIIEHLTEYKKFLSECYRILKSQGRLILTTPNLTSYDSRILIFLGKKPQFYPPNRGHVQLFSLNELKYLLTDAGFKIVKIVGVQGHTHERKTWKYPFHKLLSRTLCRWFPSLARSFVILCEK